MSPIYVPGKVTLRQTWQPMDADAAAYITAVETADGQALEEKVKIAIDNFVLGCKADGIWSSIKASCILAGARTLAGALVPLVGTAPTNFNFVSGDYDREIGLIGDGSTKYLDSNRNNNADPQNSKHVAVYASTAATGAAHCYIGAGTGSTGATNLGVLQTSSKLYTRSHSALPFNAGSVTSTGLIGHSRASSTSYLLYTQAGSLTGTTTSQAPFNGNLHVFADNPIGAITTSNARLAFYSIGESLDLALLDARVTDLINAIGVAIP